MGTPQVECIALYGSLVRGTGGLERLGISGDLVLRGECAVEGQLFDLGEYPGLKLGPGAEVRGELYEILSPRALDLLDGFEGYDPGDLPGSLYVRRRVRLLRPPGDAWVYEFNGSVSGSARIESGDWRHHLHARRRGG